MVTYSKLAGKRVVSYSKLADFHSCPRKYELLNILHANPPQGGEDNIDFMFGHAVGTGLQMMKAGLSLEECILYATTEWKADIYAIPPKKKKSFWHSIHAVNVAQNTAMLWMNDYEVFEWVDSEGNPHSGIETYFRIELAGDAVYEGHIDLLLIHKVTRKLCVFEIKTNAFSIIHEATYANSYQVDGYTLFCALLQEKYGEEFNIAPSSTVDTRYIIYKVPSQEWELMPLTKSLRHWRKFWMDVNSDINTLDTYTKEENFPTRGGSCYDYFRPCFFFGTCHYPNHRFANYAPRFSESESEPEIFSKDEVDSLLINLSVEVAIREDDTEIVNKIITTDTGLVGFEL